VLGFEDEVWWSRLAQPNVSAWADKGTELHLEQQQEAKGEKTEPKALACYGLLRADTGGMLLRFVEERPISSVTTQFLAWSCERLQAEGKRVLVVVWDNAAWHVSREVRTWIKEHNRAVKQAVAGVRILVCRLPTKSPWLNAIEPKWVHGKKQVVEPTRKLSATELKQRVCSYYGCDLLDPIAKQVA
jgi:transposase